MIVGIDSSTTSTAVVISEGSSMQMCILLSPKSKDIKERCSSIIQDVVVFVNKYAEQGCIINIEASAFRAVGKVIDLAMLLGAIFYSLKRDGYNCFLIPPTTNKKNYTGNGKATKEEMQEKTSSYVLDKFKEYKKIDDLVDAYALSLIQH